jgi:hypothetical protein
MKILRKPIKRFFRRCDLISLSLTIVLSILAFLYENWIFYDFLAGCICVAGIKIFHFKSLKQAYISMTIMFVSISILGTILHYLFPRSYNDYAG